MTVNAIAPARGVNHDGAGGGALGAALPPALLPASEPPTLGQMQDAMSQLYAAMSKVREAQVSQSNARVESSKAQREAAALAQKKALERAKEAAEEGGFFDWLSEDIGLGAAVGLVTFNYPLVIADIAMHKLGLFDELGIKEEVDVIDAAALATGRVDVLALDLILRKTELTPQEARDILEQCGIPQDAPGISKEDIEPIAKKLLIANLAVASLAATALSCGTTGALCVALTGLAISYAGRYVAEEQALDGALGKGTSKWVGLGMQIFGTTAACMSGFAGGATIMPANASRGAAVATGFTSAMRGTDQIVSSVNEHERDVANIDAESARYALARLERVITQIIDTIKDVYESHRKAAETLQGAIETANQTDLALANGIKG